MNPYKRGSADRVLAFEIPDSPEPERRPLRELSPEETAVVARNRAAVHTHMPELVPIIKELQECGMIDGWRSVGEVVLFNGGGR